MDRNIRLWVKCGVLLFRKRKLFIVQKKKSEDVFGKEIIVFISRFNPGKQSINKKKTICVQIVSKGKEFAHDHPV